MRLQPEYVSPMAAIFFEQKLGADAKVNDPSSIIMFRDHLTYLHEVMPQERVQLGLLDVARQLKDKQEEFAKKQGVIYYGERMGYRLFEERRHAGYDQPTYVLLEKELPLGEA